MPTLVPGSGDWTAFDAIVAGLGQIGSGQYDEAQAIARWATLPHLTMAAPRKVGLVAFHAAGIDRIDFYLEGGSAVSVSAMIENADNGVLWDYNATFDPASVDDGLVEVRAIVYPVRGYARVMSGVIDTATAAREKGEHSLWINANADGTLPAAHVYCNSGTGNDTTGDGSIGNPYATVGKALRKLVLDGTRDGGTIHVTGGSATWPNQMADSWDDNDQYCTLALEGTAVIDAAETANYQGLGCTYQRVLGAARATNQITSCSLGQAGDTPGRGSARPFLLLQEVGMVGSGLAGAAGVVVADWTLGWGAVGFVCHDVENGPSFATYVIDGEIHDIGEDFMDGNQGLIANLYCHDGFQPGDNHSDLLQYNNGFGGDAIYNVILYGIRARRVGTTGQGVQGFFLRTNGTTTVHKDFAIVDCDFAYAGNSQILQNLDHLVIWHSQFLPNAVTGTGGTLLIIDDTGGETVTVSNVSVRNSVFYTLTITATGGPNPADDTWADDNHYISGGNTPGTNATTGGTLAALYVDPSTEDYSPKTGGDLCDRASGVLVAGDIDGAARFNLGAIGPKEQSNVPAPNLADRTILFQFGVPVSVLLTNTGGDVTDTQIDDPTHSPVGISVEVSGATVRVFGTPSPS